MNLLKDRIAIITGAGTGIGKGIARAFGREGAKLVIASRKEENLNATAEELR
ncbi:MAG: SDR family NAD(P)-dependent oxidoreductase, partial [Planctomycetota bacterium]|nr:SDR family NAD(P)-dependent oxidoreductase [Planctomycetota bacterium]